MHGLRINDLAPQGFLAYDLRDFLALLGDDANTLLWHVVGDVWATGERSDELEKLADSKERVPSGRLIELASAVTQVIDGEFAGYLPQDDEPWVIIRAIDSSYYEFICRAPEILRRARDRFVHAIDC